MARQTVKTKKSSVVIKSKAPSSGMVKCNMCGGKGYHKARKKK